MEQAIARLEASGFHRTGTVMEPGEYAVRGGILDLFAPGHARPCRLDFFGDTLESIRQFDPVSQRTQAAREHITLLPISELPPARGQSSSSASAMWSCSGQRRATTRFTRLCAPAAAIPATEHSLPLFYSHMDTLFDYLPDAVITLDHLGEDAKNSRA